MSGSHRGADAAQSRTSSRHREKETAMRHEGSLGPVPERRMPVIPSRWRLPALVATVVLCIALFVTAVMIGIHR